MQKIIKINSCKNCPYKKYTESAFYCEKMSLGTDKGEKVWRQIIDENIIHTLCPLETYIANDA